jgi:hypothetical protein
MQRQLIYIHRQLKANYILSKTHLNGEFKLLCKFPATHHSKKKITTLTLASPLHAKCMSFYSACISKTFDDFAKQVGLFT